MDMKSVINTRHIAREFVKRAEEVIHRIGADESLWITGCKETASLRRISLDLSRALSDMRKPEGSCRK